MVSTRGFIEHSQTGRPLTLQEGQAGVELGGAVAEGQGATRCPGAAARCRCHTVLFQQDCNHLSKTASSHQSTRSQYWMSHFYKKQTQVAAHSLYPC